MTGSKTNVGQVGNLRGGWLPPPVHREGGRGRLPIGRRLPTCPTKSRPPTDARSVFHGISRAEGPLKQTTKGDRLSYLTPRFAPACSRTRGSSPMLPRRFRSHSLHRPAAPPRRTPWRCGDPRSYRTHPPGTSGVRESPCHRPVPPPVRR